MLGAAWRENLRWPDRRIGKDPAHLDEAVAFIRRHRRGWSPCRTGPIGIPITSRRAQLLTEAVFNAGLRRYPAEGEAWKAEWICYYFINDSAPPSFVVDVSEYYEQKRQALDCHASQFRRADRTPSARV